MTVRLSDTSLDPYARVFMPTLSPYTSATGGGSVRVWGAVYTPDGAARRSVDRRPAPAALRLRADATAACCGSGSTARSCRVDAFALTGDRTALELSGASTSAQRRGDAARQRRRQPGGAAGRAARRARRRAAPRCRRRLAAAPPRPTLSGNALHHRRAAALVRRSPRARGHQRHRHLRCHGGAPRRPAGARSPTARVQFGGRLGPARAGADRLRRHAHRPRPAPALPRGHAFARRRRR